MNEMSTVDQLFYHLESLTITPNLTAYIHAVLQLQLKKRSRKMFASTSVFCLLAAALANPIAAFAPAPVHHSIQQSSSSSAVFLSTGEDGVLDRRDAFAQATKFAAGIALATGSVAVPKANAGAPSKVVVAGATGQTGRRVLERLAQAGNLEVIGGVRNVDKATASLEESSTVVRGAMVQKVASVDTSAVNLKRLDVVKDSIDDLAASMEGATSLVIATGFIPGNPLKMNDFAHEVVSRSCGAISGVRYDIGRSQSPRSRF
jgi:hypothetical protein